MRNLDMNNNVIWMTLAKVREFSTQIDRSACVEYTNNDSQVSIEPIEFPSIEAFEERNSKAA